MKNKYPKAFEKWFDKNRETFGFNDDAFKHCMYQAWNAAAERIYRSMKRTEKIAMDFQHEDFDYLMDFVKEMK